MDPDILEKIGTRIYHGLGNNIVVAVLFIILLLVGVPFIYGYYHYYFITPLECCGGIVQPIKHTEYGYYSINNFLSGNELHLDKDGLTYTNYYSGALNLTYYSDNQTWVLHDSIDDAIPFKIFNPVTGAHVEGIFTPNSSFMNDTFSTDILVVNWDDRVQKGSCYQVTTNTWRTLGKIRDYNEGSLEKNRRNIGLNQYDEIRVVFIPYKPLDKTTPRAEDVDLTYHQENIVAEKNCTPENELTTGSWTTIAFSLERR